MRTLTLSIIAALSLGTGIAAYGQMGQGSGPGSSGSMRGSSSGTYGGSPSYSGGSSGSYSSPSRSSDSPSYNSGSSGGIRSTGSGSYDGGSRNSGSSGSSSSGNSNTGSYSSNNDYYNQGGSYSGSSGSSSGSSSSGASTVFNRTKNTYKQVDEEQLRNTAIKDIRKALSTYDKSSQKYTVSGTTPSTITGLGGTRIKINPADFETVDGKPVTGDIEVELKELDSPEKMALAGAPTMSDGNTIISGGSYYFGMSAGGQELKLKEGSTMEVDLPQIVDDPDMEVYLGEVDGNGNVNWKRTGQPLQGKGGKGSVGKANSGIANPATGGTNTEGQTGDDQRFPNGGSGNENGNTTGNGVRNPSAGNSGNNAGNQGSAANAYYSTTSLTQTGWVNADKPFRGGCKMFVEVEGADPATTQVYMLFKGVKTLVEGKPEQGFSTNNFIFENVPTNQEVKIVAVSKVNGSVLAGSMPAKTKARAKLTLPMKHSNDSAAAEMFTNN